MSKPPATHEYSLIALRAFREVALQTNFTMAAKSLSITQSAISHHIKLLEKKLGRKLFERRGRSLELSDEGKALLHATDEALAILDTAITNVHNGVIKRRVVLGVLSSFASKWLLPRLGGFYLAHPDIELIVRSVNHTINPEREPVDLAVITTVAAPTSSRVVSTRLWREKLFPVCSQSYLKNKKQPLTHVADLKHHVILHDETEIAAERGFDWQTWLAHFNAAAAGEQAKSRYFSQSDLVLQAAVGGYGIALTRTSLATTDIKKGLLFNPLPDNEIPMQSACFLCGLKPLWDSEKVTLLRNWLLKEAATDNTFHENR